MPSRTTPLGPFVCEGLIVQSPAGWRTPNAIDPQVLFAEDRMWMVYGSFGLGLYLLELDPATGLRKDGYVYADHAAGKRTFDEYYGVHLASGSLEGGVLSFARNVPVLENGEWTNKNYYYLMTVERCVYNMRCGRSEKPQGPYVDVNGNPLVCSTDIGTGNKMLGSFRWEEDPVDYYCPRDTTICSRRRACGSSPTIAAPTISSTRSSRAPTTSTISILSQYDFNSDGWPVMNPNRYAGEEIQDVTADELLNVSAGKFEAVLFRQGVDELTAQRVVLKKDGTMDGAFKGTWRMYDSRYISIETQGDEYLGVVMPAWIDHQNAAGITVSAMGRRSGMALIMNSTNKI